MTCKLCGKFQSNRIFAIRIRYLAKRLATEIRISERQVERIIKDLKASGKIQRFGANKGGYWKVN